MKKHLWWLLLVWVGLFCCARRGEQPLPASSPQATLRAVQPSVSAAPKAKAAPAKQWVRPFLYRVVGPKKPFYILGTIHLADARLDEFPPELVAAFNESDSVFTEIPLDQGTKRATLKAAILPEGQTLKEILPGALYERLVAALASKGIRIYALMRSKPWVVAMQVEMLDQMFALSFKKPLDEVLTERAERDDKVLGALETAQEQVAVFDTLTSSEQLEYLERTLEQWEKEQIQGANSIRQLLESFLNGEDKVVLELLNRAYDPSVPLMAKLNQRLLTDRNALMTERILKQVRAVPERTALFAVGTAHVIGDDGIAARLRKLGFQVERVAAR